jgi:glycosyltransferase involved in cell wall biosynthesis
VGGSEQILTMLDRALTEAGHRSVVIAAKGSRVAGTLLESPAANGPLDDSVRRWGQQVHQQLIREALANYSVDLVHMHSLDFHTYLPGYSVPVLATLHLPPDWYPPTIFEIKRQRFYMNCVSSSQQRCCPPIPPLLPYVTNGIDTESFTLRPNARRNYALAMGRICPEKGFHFAISAAKKARTDLILAGQVFPYEFHQNYFRTEIQPQLDSRRRFIGPAGFSAKRRLLSDARCLLIPSTVAETSSLVAMEALASGTPVIAFRSGALPEIVEHGRTGFLVSDAAEMADAIHAAASLDPEACRAAARTRFSSAEMIRRYFEIYDQIALKADVEHWERTRPCASWLVAW